MSLLLSLRRHEHLQNILQVSIDLEECYHALLHNSKYISSFCGTKLYRINSNHNGKLFLRKWTCFCSKKMHAFVYIKQTKRLSCLPMYRCVSEHFDSLSAFKCDSDFDSFAIVKHDIFVCDSSNQYKEKRKL